MTDPPIPRPDQKARDASLVLPVSGVLLLASPVLSLFTQSGALWGIPAAFLYVFGIWFGLILIAFWLSRRLAARDGEEDD